jgi:FkbM family methyltransferase
MANGKSATLLRLMGIYSRWVGNVPLLHRMLSPFLRGMKPKDGQVLTISGGPGKGLQWVFSNQYDIRQGFGVYETDVQEALARWLREGDVLVDVGGYAGFFSLLGAKLVGPGGCVFCFEPFPNNMAMCQENLKANAFDNVELLPAALSDHDGEGVFEYSGNLSTARFSSGGDSPAENLTVAVSRLDTYGLPPVKLIKIDVEGFAGGVLRGARETLARSPECRVVVEVHTMDELAAVQAALEGLGFLYFDMEGEPLDEGHIHRGILESHTSHIVAARKY